MLLLHSFGLVAAVTLFETVNAINGCPTADTVFTGAGGIRYRICADTDFVGKSTSVTPNVASTIACAKLCDQSINCFKAVYDTTARACHFKALTKINWVGNARYDVIQAEQVNIARCPSAETKYTRSGVSGYMDGQCERSNDLTESLQDLQGH
jgi:galactose oxidase